MDEGLEPVVPASLQGKASLPPFLASGGQAGALIANSDWSSSPLGSPARWPALLEHALGICLGSRGPLALVWGSERTHLYNDAFRELCGSRGFDWFGRDVRECWASAWPALASGFERAWRGEGYQIEDTRLLWDRGNGLQETFFAFSFIPVRAEEGQTVGVLYSVIETTSKVLSARRAVSLAEIVTATAGATSVRDALAILVDVLGRSPLDVPYALVYAIDAGGGGAELVAHTPSTPAACRMARIDSPVAATAWPIADVVEANQSELLTGLDARFELTTSSPSAATPDSALLLPITTTGSMSPLAVLIVATSPRLRFDAEYRRFFDELALALSNSVGSALAQEELRRRAEQLSALDRARTAFFSDVSHEFRTPLTLLAGPLEDELAEREAPLPPARRDRLQTAHRNTLRLIKLVNSLLDFSRIEAGRATVRYQATQLGTLTSELASMFRSAIERVGLTLEVRVEAVPEPVFVDREMWEKIVLNLMSNAFKYTIEGGIRVQLSCLPATVELSVADTGIGIPSSERPRLFERFHRVPGAPSRTREGSGIGLALVRELARLHGGEVTVTSEVGKGSTFTVSIPRGRAHLAAELIDADASPSPAGAGVAAYVQEALHWPESRVAPSSSRGEALSGSEPKVEWTPRAKVLLADDNADLRDYVTRLLEPNYQVVAVPDGEAALELVPSFAPDLVLTDVMMPRLGGIGLLRALRADVHTRQLPVILLSARTEEEAEVDSGERGPDDYLVKPFSARELIARVRTHLALSRVRRERIEQLEQANQELEAFSYSVSHDLRTPLRAIDGFSNAILKRKAQQLDDEGRQYLTRVRKATARMGELIDELLRLSRVSRASLVRQRVQLGALADKVAAALHEQHPAHPVHFSADPDIEAYADPRLLQIVLENLFDNSWKFTSRRSDARVHFGQVARAALPTYFVQDNGAGFDQNFVHRLFQPFQRLHAESDFSGTGIGLAIVHRIIVRHGGRIWAESSANTGATFYFTLTGKT